MTKDAKEKETTKERIVVLENGKNKGIGTNGISCCSAPLIPYRFW